MRPLSTIVVETQARERSVCLFYYQVVAMLCTVDDRDRDRGTPEMRVGGVDALVGARSAFAVKISAELVQYCTKLKRSL